MADLAALQAQRASLIQEIQKRGGRGKAPNYEARLADVENQLRAARGPATPGAAGNGLGIGGVKIPENPIKNVNTALQADADLALKQAQDNNKLANPNVNGPTGSQTVTTNPDGTTTVDQRLTPDQQAILDKDENLSNMGRELAQERLRGGGFGQAFSPAMAGRQGTDPSGAMSQGFNPQMGPRNDYDPNNALSQAFNPQLTARTGTGDLVADRARIEDQVFASLTKNNDRTFGKEREELDQYMANRGIPRDPNDPQYKEAVRQFNERKDNATLDARTRATQLGGEEYSRSFGIGETARGNDYNQAMGTAQFGLGQQSQRFGQGEQIRSTDYGQGLSTRQQQQGEQAQRFGQQEQTRSTDFNQGLAARQQNYSEIAGLSGFGTGVQQPNFQPYQGAQVNYGSASDMAIKLKQLGFEGKQLEAALAQLKRTGGGGSSGGRGPTAPTPEEQFNAVARNSGVI